MNEELSFIERTIERLSKHNWWDNTFLFLYIVVFGTIGILMRQGVIRYPESVSELIGYIFNAPKELSVYFAIFYIVFIANIVIIATFVANDYGAFKLLTGDAHYCYIEDRKERIIGSIAAMSASILINIFLFPMFMVIYLIAVLLMIYAFLNN